MKGARMSTSGKAPGKKFQPQENLLDLKRSALHSHFRKQVDQLSDVAKHPLLSAFAPSNIWPWIASYLKYAFHRKHRYVEYPPEGDQGVYALKKDVKLAVAGDWGTGTEESFRVAKGMLNFGPDYTIHLGDIYYVGDTEEVDENFLGKDAQGYAGVVWPKGNIGSFTLCVNHDMYAKGNAYYEALFPSVGVPSSRDKKQLAAFFCLENDTWRILGLDTGYNSVGLPILGQIPLINKIPWVGADARFRKEMLQWLREKVNPKARPRATILLTHHQCFSAFEDQYPRPAKQLAEFFGGQQIIWIWGHEHRMAVYGKHTDKNGITTYARCLGHGGMPVELNDVKHQNVPLQYYDHRTYETIDKTNIGYNGFLNIQIEENVVKLDYRDVTDTTVLTEEFRATSNAEIQQKFTFVSPELSKGNAAPDLPVAKAATKDH
jgi:hypothetical protein